MDNLNGRADTHTLHLIICIKLDPSEKYDQAIILSPRSNAIPRLFSWATDLRPSI